MAISAGDGSIILKTKIDESGLKKGFASMKGLATKAGKAFLVVGAAAATATIAVTKMAVSAYANYEQLVGGIETLFKDSAGKMLEYANQAFQTAGLSANEYMETATSFSASLLSSLGGDTEKAADYANRAIIDMSDNANKMGTSMEMIQNAYQGFAKQNYTMLDNLKLGYGGTKTEMERLVREASQLKDVQEELGITVDANNTSFGNIVNAISVMQEQMGIAGTTADEAEKTISGSLGMVKASWQNLLTAMAGGGDLDRAINNFVYSLEKFTANIVPVIERTLLGLGQAIQKTLPMLVQTVVAALVQQIPNLVVAVYNMIVGLFKGLVLGIKALFTGGTAKATKVVKGNISGISNDASSAANNMNKVADATKKAGKEAKKATAAFDDLNILSSGASSADSGDAETEMPSVNAGVSGGGGLLQPQQYSGEIDAELATIMAIAGGALLAIGILLLFFGHPFMGIGFIIAGAVTVGVAMAQGQQLNLDEITNGLTTVMAIAGGALLALGIILLWIGGVVGKGVAIGMIIAGGALIVSAVAAKAAFAPDDVGGWLTLIMGIAAGALLALGIILCMVGSTPLGVGMIIAGSVALVSAVALNFDVVKDQITGWVAVIMGIVGAAALVIGIVLTASGAHLALGIALIAVGAIALATPIALNWDVLVETLKGPIGLITALVGAAVLVLGIILTCTGNFALGIPLLVAGAAALITPIAINWDGIVDKVKGIWDKVKQFWNTYIAPIFTAKWWADLGKRALNGLIGIFEKGINFIIGKINTFVRGIDKVISAVGDIFGADWSVAQIPEVKIPRLAKGGVIPPNREFLAVLGDQKNGTNIEAPAELIKQMAMEALLEVGATGQTTKEEHYYLNETELMSIVYKLFKGGERLQGPSLISGGAH